MDIIPEPVRPPSELWHHFVECDDALHRIGRMAVLRGMNMFLGSQWFAIPKHLVQWYLEDPLPYDYTFYAQHIIVADENYFTTLYKNSPYCQDLMSKALNNESYFAFADKVFSCDRNLQARIFCLFCSTNGKMSAIIRRTPGTRENV
jgi:hypothetical protein